MTEDQVRALVRDALARHLGTPRTHASTTDGSSGAEALAKAAASRPYPPAMHAPHDPRRAAAHVAHGRFVFLAPTEPDSPCVVEPQVKCHHCGFCQSYGH